MNADAVWPLLAAYGAGVCVFSAVGFLEWAMSAVELRRIDRDEWSHGEPWQQRHNNLARDRENATIDNAFTIIRYSPVWPLLVLGVLVRMSTRHRKERATHE